jgi:hypothetical protein
MIRGFHRPASRLATATIAVGLVATLAGSVTVAIATTPAKSFKACSSSKDVLALANAKGKCKSGFTKVTLSARGPKGAQGLPGAPGAPGGKGDKGDQGDPGPELPGYLDYQNGPSFDKGTGDVQLADLSLPAGTYMVTASVALTGDQSGSALVTCTLEAGIVQDVVATTVPADDGSTSVALVSALTLQAASDVAVECNNHNTAVFANNVRIMAAPAGSVTFTST